MVHYPLKISRTHIDIVLIIIIINADLNGSLKDISGLLEKGSIIFHTKLCDTVENGGDLGMSFARALTTSDYVKRSL